VNIDLFDFDLPETLIAQTPLADRTMSRLLALNKTTGETGHYRFEQLLQFLQAGDTLVLNDTRVIPARLFGFKEQTGAKVEFLLLKNLGSDRWETLVRPGKRVRKGTVVFFAAEETAAPLLEAVIEEEREMGSRIVRFRYSGIFNEILDRLGQMPLPPYIREQLDDKERYQTVFAKTEGSAAAPTAGLHFTRSYLDKIEQKGVSLAYVTLHVGLGTFRPVSVKSVEQHEMHEEYYELSAETAESINRTRQRGGRVVAVGTTSARTLETAAARFESAPIGECRGWTNIFIYPGYEFKLVDALLTNFHLPKSTLLMLISALAGRESVLAAYKEAIEREYRFFSFGDAMFIY
jgi:S-adenosylmethionine:tRNA ribosyltransferase-isomerase